jgi:hypothetical protein
MFKDLNGNGKRLAGTFPKKIWPLSGKNRRKDSKPIILYMSTQLGVFVLFILWMNWSPAAISSSTNWVVERAGLGWRRGLSIGFIGMVSQGVQGKEDMG